MDFLNSFSLGWRWMVINRLVICSCLYLYIYYYYLYLNVTGFVSLFNSVLRQICEYKTYLDQLLDANPGRTLKFVSLDSVCLILEEFQPQKASYFHQILEHQVSWLRLDRRRGD